jgi:transcriptional regulator with XRE-family HTH domain
MSPHLRAWRSLTGLTLQQVAGALGISHTTLLRYEKGIVMPSDDTVRRLAEIYGCTPAELQLDPKDRRKGQRVHLAIELAQNLPPEFVDQWLEIGRLMIKKDNQ